MVQDFAPLTWQNGSGNPINATNLQRYETYLDALADAVRQGAAKKARAATTGNITLSGTQTVDSVALTTGQKCLVKNQTTQAQNGLYVVAAGAWSRAPEADDNTELTGGILVAVAEGTTNGGKLFRCTNTGAITLNTTAITFTEVGAAAAGGTTYLTDGTTPLKYSAFLSAASGNHNAAWQNAINALFANTAFNAHLDLEGHKVTITQGASIPTSGTGGKKSIVNGEIEAQSGFTGGDYMLKAVNCTIDYYMRLVNVTFNGQGYASWIYWDKGNFIIEACNFNNNKAGTAGDTARNGTQYARAGIFCSDGGAGSNADSGFWINNCWFATNDGPTDPTSRTRIGIVAQTGDNKIGGGTTMSYFRHSLILEAPGCVISNFHPFQGKTPVGADMTNHTASIKLTNGRCGTQISGLYLGKSFLEISNESNTNQRDIGEVCIGNMRAFAQNGDAAFAHIVVRDYSGLSDGQAKVTDITLQNSKFINGGAVQSLCSKIHNPSAFDRTAAHGIYFSGNTFESTGSTYDVAPQGNPITLRRNFTGNTTDKVFSTTGYLPFALRPRRLLSATAVPSGGTDTTAQPYKESSIASDDITVTFDNGWIGDLVIGCTCNNELGVFVEA